MSNTKHRTSFALDEATAVRLKRLAQRWKVSQAEVVRRAVKLAEETTVQQQLQEYRKRNRLSRDAADSYLKQVSENRANWGRKE
jgi:hypothetical protein